MPRTLDIFLHALGPTGVSRNAVAIAERMSASGWDVRLLCCLHWLYHCYASVTFALVTTQVGLTTRMRGRPTRQAPEPSALPRAG